MNINNNLMPASLDRQISTPDQDAFGHRHFAEALRSLIESDKHAPPFSIGLLGGWGTGKSTIKDLYVADLQNDARKDQEGRTRPNRIHTITFNAWRFGGKEQDIKRALLRHVFLELGGDEETLQDRLFRQLSETREEIKGVGEYTLDLLKAWAMPIPAFVLFALFLLGLLGVLSLAFSVLSVDDDLSRAIITLALIWASPYLLKQFKAPPVAAHRPVTRIDLPITSAEQYEDLFLDQIKEFKSGRSNDILGRKGKACERLVVFVDDLDRLSAEEMVLGLDAVRTFMEIPEALLPTGLGLVFVISCDETRVADALARGRRRGDLPGTVVTQSDARRYLDRIFQFRLEIPPFPRQDMREYAMKQLSELSGIEADLSARGVSVEALVDRMIHVGVQDPRNALQIVNAFAQAWWIAKKRETEELGTERPGGLHEGAVTSHPLSLGALSAIRVNFPDFYRDLQAEPELLHRLTDVLVRGKPVSDQPLATQQIIIERYLKKRVDGSNAPDEVHPELRPLRQFLASLGGIRWPDSLQSLLLLSEDPITRKFGSKAPAIYNALVSGDTQGVLEGLARHTDAKPLRPDEARLLSNLAEELRHETTARRTNASRVIADLVNRLPADTANLLIGSLCRQLDDSADLRAQLGIQKIGKILDAAHDDDRRAVASRLVEDVLTIGEDVHFRLESMEPPNLDEAVAFARSTVTLALPIRSDVGLDPAPDAQLLDWLVERTVRIGGHEYQLPFEEFEHWMGDHEDHLLPALETRYTDLLATELETEAPLDFDASAAINRTRKVFKTLWSAGEISRPNLWNGLTLYVALKLPEATRMAWEEMAEHVTSPSAAQVSGFVAAFSERLAKDAADEDWKLDSEPAGQALLSLIRTRLSDLDEAALRKLSDLAIVWSQDDPTANISCDIVMELQRGDSPEAQRVFDSWAERILGDLPIECVNLAAETFLDLEENTKSTIIAQLEPVISTDSIEKSTGERYRAFVKGVPDDAWDSDPLKGHLDRLVPQVANRHSNPNNYLYRVFPAVAKVFHHSSPAILGPALHNLFAQAKGQPKHYAWLHSWMVGRWPESSVDLSPYDPEQIFRDGHDFTLAQPQESTKGILASLRDMLTRGLVPADQRGSLIDAACAAWGAAPDAAIDTFANGYGDLTPDQAATLAEPIDWTSDEQQALLSRAMSSIVESQSSTDRIQTTNRMLDHGPLGPEDEPDRGLRLWFDAQGDTRRDIISAAIVQVDLNDPHRRRLWQQAIQTADSLDPTFFLDVIPQLVRLSPIEETAAALFGDYDLVVGVLGSKERRAELAQRLMNAFPDAPTKTVKSLIAGWCKKLSGDASLSELKHDAVTDEDMDILKRRFGGTSRLRKLERERKAN